MSLIITNVSAEGLCLRSVDTTLIQLNNTHLFTIPKEEKKEEGFLPNLFRAGPSVMLTDQIKVDMKWPKINYRKEEKKLEVSWRFLLIMKF